MFGAPGVVVLGYGYWRRHFGGDTTVLGSTLNIGNGAYTVIGIAPRGFTGAGLTPVDVWLPFRAASKEVFDHDVWKTERHWYWLDITVRVRPDVSADAVRAELTTIHRRARSEDERSDDAASILAAPLILGRGPRAPNETVVSRWLAGVSLIVLIIACANVANLLLARGIRQRREMAIRLALGVSRARLIGQLVTESVLLAGSGGIAALLIAQVGGELMGATLFPDVLWFESALTTRVLVFTMLASLLTGIAAGVVPALQASRPDLTEALKEGGRGTSGERSRTRTAFLLVQGVLSVVLLIGAGLFVRSLDKIRSMDIGIEPDGVLLMSLEFNTDPSYEEEMRLYDRAVARLQRLPGVQHAGASVAVPFGPGYALRIKVPGVDSPELESRTVFIHAVSPDYFATLDLQLRSGRGFTSADGPHAPPVTVVNETMARVLWPTGDAIGKCLQIGPDDPPCTEVVGIVQDAREQELLGDDVAWQLVTLNSPRRFAEKFLALAQP